MEMTKACIYRRFPRDTPACESSACFRRTLSLPPGGKLWLSLAKAEQKLGLNITDEQIAELAAHTDDINYDVAEAREKECRHDVMSHVYAYGKQ